MEGMSDPQDSGAWRFRRLALVRCPHRLRSSLRSSSAGRLTAFAWSSLESGWSVAASPWAPGSCYGPAGAPGAGGGPGRCSRSPVVLAAVSNLLLITSAASGPNPNRTPSDIALSLGLLVGVAGIATFPLAKRRPTDLTRMVLDGIVLGGSSLFVASVTAVPADPRRPGPSSAFSIVVPVIDVVIATVATLLFLRGCARRPTHARPGRTRFRLLCRFRFRVRRALQPSDGFYPFGSITDIGWIARRHALIALAAHSPGSQAAAERRTRRARPRRSPAPRSCSLLFLLAAVLSLVNLGQRNADRGFGRVVAAGPARRAGPPDHADRGQRAAPAEPGAAGDRAHPLAAQSGSAERPAGQLGRRRHLRGRSGRGGDLRQPRRSPGAGLPAARADRTGGARDVPRPPTRREPVPGQHLLCHRGDPGSADDELGTGQLP